MEDKIASAAEQLHTKIRFRCFVVLEKKSVHDLRNKKKEKLIAAKSGLAEMGTRYFKRSAAPATCSKK